jgi:hypothetical protein
LIRTIHTYKYVWSLKHWFFQKKLFIFSIISYNFYTVTKAFPYHTTPNHLIT